MELTIQIIKKVCLGLAGLVRSMISICSIPKQRLWLEAILFFVILGLTLPLSPVQAQLGGWVGNAGDLIGEKIGSIIAGFMLTIPAALLTISSIILGWATDPSGFINVPYTSGGVIDIGWPIVRDLANMALVLILVIIGLATALRLSEYEARKTLPRLLIDALLINFTPCL